MIDLGILEKNCYFWSTSRIAKGRRENEKKRKNEAAEILEKLGFTTEIIGNKVIATRGDIKVIFYYKESCKHVYKKLQVYVNNVKKDIRVLKKL
ncbi:MAG: hypothetical protein N2114_06085 [Candidatus Goldbacteria bacterium]|nr:hypothetical protein [Candidatus Goldiibacteriota bacterium]